MEKRRITLYRPTVCSNLLEMWVFFRHIHTKIAHSVSNHGTWPLVTRVANVLQHRRVPIRAETRSSESLHCRRSPFVIARQHTAADARYWYSNSVRPSDCP